MKIYQAQPHDVDTLLLCISVIVVSTRSKKTHRKPEILFSSACSLMNP